MDIHIPVWPASDVPALLCPKWKWQIIHIPAGDTLKKMAYISREAQFQVGKGKGVYTHQRLCWATSMQLWYDWSSQLPLMPSTYTSFMNIHWLVLEKISARAFVYSRKLWSHHDPWLLISGLEVSEFIQQHSYVGAATCYPTFSGMFSFNKIINSLAIL